MNHTGRVTCSASVWARQRIVKQSKIPLAGALQKTHVGLLAVKVDYCLRARDMISIVEKLRVLVKHCLGFPPFWITSTINEQKNLVQTLEECVKHFVDSTTLETMCNWCPSPARKTSAKMTSKEYCVKALYLTLSLLREVSPNKPTGEQSRYHGK